MVDTDTTNERINELFDSIVDEYRGDNDESGAVILGIYSESAGIGYHAASGDVATIITLVAAIIERTARGADIPVKDLMKIIADGYSDLEEKN